MHRPVQKKADLLESVLDSAAEGIVGLDALGNCTFVNRAARDLLGYSTDECLGRSLHDLAHYKRRDGSPYPAADCPIFQSLVTGRKADLIEETLWRKSGAPLEAFYSCSPIEEAGAVVGGVVTIVDLSEQRRAEQQLNFQASLLDAVGQAVIATDTEGRITYWNRAAETMFGWSSDQVLGRSIVEVTPADVSREQASEIFARLAEGESWSGEFQVRRKDGSAFPSFVTDTPILDSSGRLVGVVGVSSDLTGRRRAEAERERLLAREQAARAEAEAARERAVFLGEASTLLAGSLDYETTLASLTRLAVPRLADICVVDLVQDDGSLRRIAAHVDPDKEAVVRDLPRRFPVDRNGSHPIMKVLRTGRSEFVPRFSASYLELTTTDPQHLAMLRLLNYQSGVYVPLIARGRTLGVLGLLAAESGRHYTEDDQILAEELGRRSALAVDNARLYREAQLAIALRDDFLSIASHELRTPLTTVQAYAQMLVRRLERDGSLDPERLAQSLKRVQAQAGKLAALIRQLLDISRLEAGKLMLERSTTDLVQLVVATVEDARARALEQQITLKAPERVEAFLDPLRIEQVLVNLLDNAIKYSVAGSVVEVELLQPTADTVSIFVRDRGVGIPEERRAQLFERYYQAHRDGHRSGMGLGLYISRQIVDLHGGELRAEFPEDGGTRFIVSLPLGTSE